MRRKVADMDLAESAVIQVLLRHKMVDKGDSNVLHDHFLHRINSTDLHIGPEVVNILIMGMQDLHQVAVGIGIILTENQSVII